MEVSKSTIDHDSDLPLYIQLRDILQTAIERGLYTSGSQLPSEPELCETYGVSRTVVRQALLALQRDGLIHRSKGKGTFVSKPKISEGLFQRLTGFYQDMAEHGQKPVSKVLKQEIVEATGAVAEHLQLPTGSKVICIERVRFVEDEPIVLVETYLPLHLCPNLLQTDLTHRSLYEYLETECKLSLSRGKRVLEARLPTNREANLLDIDEETPLIVINSVSYLDSGIPLEYYQALHRGDRSRFQLELIRSH